METLWLCIKPSLYRSTPPPSPEGELMETFFPFHTRVFCPFNISNPPPSPEGELMETSNSARAEAGGLSPPPSPEGELMETQP